MVLTVSSSDSSSAASEVVWVSSGGWWSFTGCFTGTIFLLPKIGSFLPVLPAALEVEADAKDGKSAGFAKLANLEISEINYRKKIWGLSQFTWLHSRGLSASWLTPAWALIRFVCPVYRRLVSSCKSPRSPPLHWRSRWKPPHLPVLLQAFFQSPLWTPWDLSPFPLSFRKSPPCRAVSLSSASPVFSRWSPCGPERYPRRCRRSRFPPSLWFCAFWTLRCWIIIQIKPILNGLKRVTMRGLSQNPRSVQNAAGL